MSPGDTEYRIHSFIPDTNVSKEQENRERRVSRSFVTQSLRSEVIEPHLKKLLETHPEQDVIDVLVDTDLTSVMLIEKGFESVNAGQVMPTGGEADQGEDFETAALRRKFEETHLRPVEGKRLGKMTYTLKHPSKGDRDLRVQYFSFHILPTDVSYAHDPEGDKIGGVVRLTIEQAIELLQKNKLSSKQIFLLEAETGYESAEEVALLDSLRTVREDENDIVKNVKPHEVEQIQISFLLDIVKKETEKKKSLLRQILAINSSKFSTDEIEELNTKIDQSKDQVQTRKCLREILESLQKKGLSNEDVFNTYIAAIDLSNFEEEVADKHAGLSKIEALSRFMFTLLETRYDFDTYISIAEKNPFLKEFIGKLRNFAAAVEKTAKRNGLTGKSLPLSAQLAYIHELGDGQLEVLFMDHFFLTDHEREGVEQLPRKVKASQKQAHDFFRQVKLEVNKFNQSIVQSIRPESGVTHNVKLLEQMHEVEEASVANLIRLSFSNTLPPDVLRRFVPKGKRKTNEEREKIKHLIKRYKFECRRKLMDMYLFYEPNEFFRQVQTENRPVQNQVWNKISSFPIYQIFVRLEKDGTDLRAVEVLDSDVNPEESKNILVVDVRAYKTDRGFYYVHQNGLPKEIESFMRKLMVRGYDNYEQVEDIHRRAIVLFGGENEETRQRLHERENVVFSVSELDPQIVKDKTASEQEVEDVAAVFDIIRALKKIPGVKIKNYRPTNKPGETYKSKSVGGGGKVVFAKLYIEYTPPGEVKTYHEEVMLFSPTPKEGGFSEQSAYFWFEFKKADDKKYAFSRLLSTKSLRSFIDLRYPPQIYGKPVRQVVGRFIETQKQKRKGKD